MIPDLQGVQFVFRLYSRYFVVLVSEALFLINRDVSPYAGDVYHGSPLILLVFSPLQHFPLLMSHLLLVFAELLTAASLRQIMKLHVHALSLLKNDQENASDPSILNWRSPHFPDAVAAWFVPFKCQLPFGVGEVA